MNGVGIEISDLAIGCAGTFLMLKKSIEYFPEQDYLLELQCRIDSYALKIDCVPVLIFVTILLKFTFF